MKWYQFLINYWSQITLLVGVVGYALRNVFDYKYKKKEFSFSHYSGERMKSILEFYSAFFTMQTMLTDKSIELVAHLRRMRKFTHGDVEAPFNNLLQSFGKLKVFFSNNELITLTKAMSEINEAYSAFLTFCSRKSFTEEALQQSEMLHTEISKRVQMCTTYLEDFAQDWRRTFQ